MATVLFLPCRRTTISFGFIADPDPAFYFNADRDQDSDPDQEFAITQKVIYLFIFFSTFLSFLPSKEVIPVDKKGH